MVHTPILLVAFIGAWDFPIEVDISRFEYNLHPKPSANWGWICILDNIARKLSTYWFHNILNPPNHWQRLHNLVLLQFYFFYYIILLILTVARPTCQDQVLGAYKYLKHAIACKFAFEYWTRVNGMINNLSSRVSLYFLDEDAVVRKRIITYKQISHSSNIKTWPPISLWLIKDLD